MRRSSQTGLKAGLSAAVESGMKGLSAAAALALSVFTAASVAEVDAVRPCADAGAMHQWVERLNDLRATGAPCAAAPADARQLRWNARLAESALAQAVDLARRDTISHEDAAHRSFKQRVQSVGYPLRSAAENLAVGQREFEGTLEDWLASAGHCAALMKATYSDVGLACVERRGTRYQRFWVAHLGTPARR
jgi:uncharacterized protein YkwD